MGTISNPATPKRKRGRPKGSKNKNNVSNRCSAIIKHNVRCSKQKLPGEEFCGHHIPKNRCHAYSKFGVQCSKQKIKNNCFCKYHLLNHTKYGYKKDICQVIGNSNQNLVTNDNNNDNNNNNNNNDIQSEGESDIESDSESDSDIESENDLNKYQTDKNIELWKVEEEHINIVVNNQIWKFYPKREEWVKCNDNYDQLK